MAATLVGVILTSLSVVAGILVLAASAVALDHYRTIDDCLHDDDKAWAIVSNKARDTICKPLYAVAAVTIIGILIDFIQLLVNVVGLARRETGGCCWMGLHILIFFFTLAGFGVAVHYLEYSDPANLLFDLYYDDQKNQLLMASLGIDWIFTFLALILHSLIPQCGRHEYCTVFDPA